MAIFAERSIHSMINQVPFIIQNVFLGMGGVINVIPLQLKGLTLLQPTHMITMGNQTPQGSGSSTHAKSTGVEITSIALAHSTLPNPNKASSFEPPKSTIAFESMVMDVKDVAWSIADLAAS